jgi:uncharacterized damage-inducible protein DinB
MPASDLQLLKEYDVWATAMILEQAENLTPEQFTAVPKGGYTSVRDTLVHAMPAERGWRTGWIAHEYISDLDANDFPTVASIAERWREENQLTRDYLAGVSEAELERDFYGRQLGMTITHVMMHGMQHRAEAAMMLTAYGYSPGDIDLIDYLDEQAKKV